MPGHDFPVIARSCRARSSSRGRGQLPRNGSGPVVATMEEQKAILGDSDMGGTMRLGSYDGVLTEGSLVADVL